MSEPDWSDFKVILALGRGGSLAGAARLLNFDASTVSRRLAAMEKTLGVPLIVRGGREFALTAEGKAVLVAAEAMSERVAAATGAVRAARTEINGVVRLSVPPSLFHFLQPFPAIAAERYEGLQIDLESNRRAVDLAKGDADIAVRTNRPTELDLVIAHHFDLGLCVYASKTYLEANGRPSAPEDLRHHKLILYVSKFSALPLGTWIESFADAKRIAGRVDSIDLAREMTANHAGVSVLFGTFGDASPTIERVFPYPIAAMPMFVVYHESQRSSKRVKAVVDLLTAHLVEHRSALSGDNVKTRASAQDEEPQLAHRV